MGPNRIIDGVEGLLAYIGKAAKQSLGDYIEIENVDLGDSQTFVMKDGSLMTMIRHDGCMTIVGQEEFTQADAALNTSLGAYLTSGGHAVQVVFTADPDITERLVRESQAPSRETAKRLELDLEDMFEEDVQRMKEIASSETCFLALYTRPGSMNPTERKQEAKFRQELLKANPLPTASDAPNLFRALRVLRPRHAAFVSAVVADLRQQHMACEIMEVHDACREIRRAIDPDFTAEDWKPCLFGDKIPFRDIRRDPKDISGALWPPLAPQLAPRDAHEIGLKHVQVGNRVFAPMSIRLAPQDIQVFQKLFAKTVDAKLPWRFSIVIESASWGVWDFKKLATMIFGWTNSTNGLIRRSIESVRAAKVEENRTPVRVRIDLATWAPAGEDKLLERRAAMLARAVESWGGAEIQQASGDATQSFIAGGIGASLSSTATPSLALLDDVTHFLPLYRPCSPWKQGALLLRSPDGKPWPYQPHSPLQTSSITVAYAEPRSGKSVLANAVNLALCLSPGITRLPLIAIIDVGRSSSGLISLLEHALPSSKKHLVASIRMRMSQEFAINPFDTQLGMRAPLETEMAFLLNFLLTLVTPHGKSGADSAMSALCRMAIETAYRRYGDGAQGTPKYYSSNLEGAEEVDQAIAQYALRVDDKTTWWEVVDQLFAVGAVHQAHLAQRFAVPLVQDIAAVTRESQFKDLYGEKKSGEGDEPLLAAFSRLISEAVRAYPILSRPTRFDLGEARVVSIDLAEVAKSGSAAADHQTAVCYMLARQAAARNFYLHEDDVQHFPPLYRNYHDKRIREIRQDKKHIQYDEFHRTKKVQSVQEQTIADMREGGKYGVAISLLSQAIGDFTKDMLGFATNKFILSRANEATTKEMDEIFGLSRTVRYNVRNTIRPPGPKGSTFVGIFDVKEGQCAQALNNSMGGIRLWAFSTTNEDAYVRDTLYARIGPQQTRRLLAHMYPKGSVLDEIERRKRTIDDGEVDSDGVIHALIDDLVRKHEDAHRYVIKEAA
ncbi:type IV secretion protein IcmB [Pseudoxanthomonas kaohsiungensis]|nr:type IV secretion protein IcmB [Pseudoxanthomonas kaohsiungensis]